MGYWIKGTIDGQVQITCQARIVGSRSFEKSDFPDEDANPVSGWDLLRDEICVDLGGLEDDFNGIVDNDPCDYISIEEKDDGTVEVDIDATVEAEWTLDFSYPLEEKITCWEDGVDMLIADKESDLFSEAVSDMSVGSDVCVMEPEVRLLSAVFSGDGEDGEEHSLDY